MAVFSNSSIIFNEKTHTKNISSPSMTTLAILQPSNHPRSLHTATRNIIAGQKGLGGVSICRIRRHTNSPRSPIPRCLQNSNSSICHTSSWTFKSTEHHSSHNPTPSSTNRHPRPVYCPFPKSCQKISWFKVRMRVNFLNFEKEAEPSRTSPYSEDLRSVTSIGI